LNAEGGMGNAEKGRKSEMRRFLEGSKFIKKQGLLSSFGSFRSFPLSFQLSPLSFYYDLNDLNEPNDPNDPNVPNDPNGDLDDRKRYTQTIS
jgi:hypothetical protein